MENKDLILRFGINADGLITGAKKVASTVKSMGKNIEESAAPVGDSISKTFDSGVKKVKRFSFALVGVHSIYRLLSKASNAYLAQDTETANKLQAAWIGLGSIFAPILKKIADFVIRAVAYLNVFLKRLGMVDIFANAQTKSFGKATKAVKAYKGALAGIDEITNLDVSSGGAGDVGDAGFDWTDPFQDVELNPGIVKKLEALADWTKKWHKELLIAAGILVGIWAIVKIVTFFNTLKAGWTAVSSFATKFGTTVTGTMGAAIIVFAGLAIAIKGIVDYIKDPGWYTFMDVLIGLGFVVGGIALLFGGWQVALGALVVTLGAFAAKLIMSSGDTQDLKKSTQGLFDAKKDLKRIDEELVETGDAYRDAVNRQKRAQEELTLAQEGTKTSVEELTNRIETEGITAYDNFTDAERRLYDAHIDNERATKGVSEALDTHTKKIEEGNKKEQEAEKHRQDMLKTLEKADKGLKLNSKEQKANKEVILDAWESGEISAAEASDYMSKVMTNMTDKQRKAFSKDLPADIKAGLKPEQYESALKRFGNKVSSVFNKLFGKKTIEMDVKASGNGGKGYALGLQEVPHDMMAVVHKGEAIVPAKFNKDTYFKGQTVTQDNTEVVAAINDLRYELRQKDMNAYIQPKDIINTALGGINNLNKREARGVM